MKVFVVFRHKYKDDLGEVSLVTTDKEKADAAYKKYADMGFEPDIEEHEVVV